MGWQYYPAGGCTAPRLQNFESSKKIIIALGIKSFCYRTLYFLLYDIIFQIPSYLPLQEVYEIPGY